MEIIDPQDAPTGYTNSVYPYSEIERAVADGHAVKLDASDYEATAYNIANAMRGYVGRNRMPWRVTARKGFVYVSPDTKQGETHGDK